MGYTFVMDDCLFCKIGARDIPASIIFENETSVAFLDIRPVNPGHTLVIPKAHATNIFDIDSESWSAVAETARRAAIAITQALNADGVNFVMNNREYAGQAINHPHMHVIPRFKNDGLKLWPHKSYSEGEEKVVAEKIRAALK